jgi:hypothetical protein
MKRIVTLALAAVCAQIVSADNLVVEWNRAALESIKSGSVAPPVATRTLAMLSTAQYDAINAIQRTHVGFSYRGSADSFASKEAAAAQSSYRILSSLMPGNEAAYRAKLETTLNSISDVNSRNAGIAAGNAAAESIMAMRSADGATTAGTYSGGTGVGQWRPTGPGYTNGAAPQWGNQQTWIAGSDQFAPSGPPSLSSAEYAHAYNEVKVMGGANSLVRTQDQTNMALFWASGAGTYTPPGLWNVLAGNIANDRNMDLLDSARMFGLMNVAMADAGISAWDAKYSHGFWRPETAIQNGSLDGNTLTEEDPSWTPMMSTPNHPSYISGHSSFSSAAGAALKHVLGTGNLNFSLTEVGMTRSFSSIDDAVMEAGMSRIYGGIHFSFDNTHGLAMGSAIGDWTAANAFQAVPEPATMTMVGVVALVAAARRRKIARA